MSIKNGLASALLAGACAVFQGLPAPAAAPAAEQLAQTAPGAPNVNVAPTMPGALNYPPAINDTNANRQANPVSSPTPEGAIGTGGITVTTTPQIDGYHVRRYLGIVRGVRVFQPTIGESFKASFKGIIGGNIGSYVEMCEKAREQAYDQMLERCTARGANAVLGFRYDNAAFSVNSSEMGTEVICYGTAVYIEPNQ
jgi:uncharacterized protein YbjQ (UPF0145 family)